MFWLSVLSVWLSVPECLGSLCLTGEDDDYQDASSINVILLPIDDTRSHDGDDDDDDYPRRSLPPPRAAKHPQRCTASTTITTTTNSNNTSSSNPPAAACLPPPRPGVGPGRPHNLPPLAREMYSHQMGYSPTTPNGHQVTVTDWYRIQTQKGFKRTTLIYFNTDTQCATFSGEIALYDIITKFVLT